MMYRLAKKFCHLNTLTTADRVWVPRGVKYVYETIDNGYIVAMDRVPPPAGRPPWLLPPPAKRPPRS